MAYVSPVGDITLFQGVPLDPEYRHTVRWPDNTTRDLYFNTWSTRLSAWTFTKQSYTRVNGNTIRLQAKADEILIYNYLRFRNPFRNTPSGAVSVTQWYYAFISNVSYVNENCCEVSFTVDAFTTFFNDCTLLESFVEREHSVTDGPGEHIIPENIEFGEYVYEKVNVINQNPNIPLPETTGMKSPDGRDYYKSTLNTALPFDFSNWCYVIAATFYFDRSYYGNVFTQDPQQPYDVGFDAISPVYNGLHLTVLRDVWQVNQFLANATSVIEGDESQGIVGIFMFPERFAPYKYTGQSYFPSEGYGKGISGPLINLRVQTNTTWGYNLNKPVRNNKLYTYPYTYFVATTHEGKSIILKQENFTPFLNPDTGKYEIPRWMWLTAVGFMSASPQVIMYPGKSWYMLQSASRSVYAEGEAYNGVDMNTNEKLSISSFPMCSYKTDAYMSWLAQNQGRLTIESRERLANYAINTVSTIGQTAIRAASVAAPVIGAGMLGSALPLAATQGAIPLPASLNGAWEVSPVSAAQMNSTLNAAFNLNSNALSGASKFASDTANYYFANRKAEEEMHVAAMQPPVPNGSDSPSADILAKTFGFRVWCVHLKEDAANAVDDYFTMYGYRCEHVKIPNTKARTGFTYTKTKNCNIKGLVPHEYLAVIRQGMDAGITFWNYHNYYLTDTIWLNKGILGWIGDYSLNDTTAQLQGENYSNASYSFTKSEILTTFTRQSSNSVAYYSKNVPNAPYVANPDSVDVSLGAVGNAAEAWLTLNDDNNEAVTDNNKNPVISSLLPYAEASNLVSESMEAVLFSVSEGLLNTLPENTDTITFSYMTPKEKGV